jgi:predicted esterase
VRGDLLGCAAEGPLTQSEAEQLLSGTGFTASNGVDRFRIAYRVGRGNGTGGVSTARVWLPRGVAGPADVVLVAHGSEGLADSCAPSRKQGGNIEDLAVLFAARGKVAIASDYAGLGTEGVQGYLDNRDTAYSLLDAARALRNFVGPGATTSATIALGHSQGGGAVLAAQALAKTYGPPLTAVAAFAPQYPIRFNSFGFLNALRNPTAFTISLGVSKPAIYVLRQYAQQVNHVGPQTGGDAFPAAKRASLMSAAETQCVITAGGVVQANATRVGDLFDETFRQQLLACVDGGPACTGTGQATFDFLMNNLLVGDPQGAPVLIAQGGLDNVMPAAEEASCVTDKLRGDGLTVDTCFDSGAVHTNIIERGRAHATRWLDAALAGTAAPACPSTASMPVCTP